MLTHQHSTKLKQQSDHDLTELSWLTQSDIFDRSSSSSSASVTRPGPVLSKNLPMYLTDSHRHRASPISLMDSSDSDHDNDSSSLNSSSERVITTSTTTTSNDAVSPPHSALCFWILFAIEDSKSRALTLNEICDWIEHHIEHSTATNHNHSNPSADEQSIHSARLKSKIRYHMTKQLSFFVKIIKHPINGIKLRYPLWTTDRSKRSLLLDTLLTMNARQLSLTTQYTIDLFEHLCLERRRHLLSNTNDENSCPLKDRKRDKIINHLGSSDDAHGKRKKHRSKQDSSGICSTNPSVEVVDAAMTLLLLRQPK